MAQKPKLTSKSKEVKKLKNNIHFDKNLDSVLQFLEEFKESLNEYLIFGGLLGLGIYFTPLGYAVEKNRKEIVDAISSLPSIDLSLGEKAAGEKTGPLCMAIRERKETIANILARKGAKCTEEEIRGLGKKYSKFINSFQENEAQSSPQPGNTTVDEQAVNEKIRELGTATVDEQAVNEKIRELELQIEEKERRIQEKERRIQEKEKTIQEKEKRIEEKERRIQGKERRIQENEKTIQEKEKRIQEKERRIQGKERRIQEKEKRIQENERRIQENERRIQEKGRRIREVKKKWMEISTEMEEIFKSNFFTNSNNENWEYSEDFTILESISEGRGSFNVGVFRIHCHLGECAMKIIQRMVENTPEIVEEMYRNTQIRKSDQSETSIPFVFAFPTIVPLLNFFIGDLKAIHHSIIEQRRELFEGTSAKLISKTTFLVMPVYDGTLESFWADFKQRKFNLSEEDEWFVIYQCLLTLDHFRMNRIIHGDFRPANIFIYFKNESSDDHLRIGVGDFGLAKSSAHKLDFIKDVHGENPFNNFYAPPELRKFKLNRERESFWDVFKGFDCWSLGKSMLELYCVEEGKTNEFNAALQSELRKNKGNQEFQEWLMNLIGNKMNEELKRICLILMDLDATKRNVKKCLTILAVRLWLVPHLRKEFGANWRDEAPPDRLFEETISLFDSVANSFNEGKSAESNYSWDKKKNSEMKNWREVCKIHWFSNNKVDVNLNPF